MSTEVWKTTDFKIHPITRLLYLERDNQRVPSQERLEKLLATRFHDGRMPDDPHPHFLSVSWYWLTTPPGYYLCESPDGQLGGRGASIPSPRDDSPHGELWRSGEFEGSNKR